MSRQREHNPSAWLPRLSVPAKIAIGFTIVLVLHLSVVVLGRHGLNRAEQARADQEAIREQVELVYSIDRDLAELERNVLLFAFTGYHGPELRAADLHEQLDEKLNELEAAMAERATLTIDSQSITGMRDHLRSHREIFGAVVVDRAKRRRLVDEDLERSAERFDALYRGLAAEVADDPRLLKAGKLFAAARLLIRRYINRPDASLVRTAVERIDGAARMLEAAETSLGFDASALRIALDEYERSAVQMAQCTRGYLHLVNVVLAGESEEFLRQTREARSAYAAQATQLAEMIEADAASYRSLNNAVSVLTIALGVAASWLIGRSIAPPLVAIATTFDRLAQGEACDSIPGLGRRDELGRLAAAADVFRARAAETERLLVEVTRMKELELQRAHSQKMESIGQLAAGIAHEVNTPLQAVVGNAEYLAESSQTVLAALDKLREACRHPEAGSEPWRDGVDRLFQQRRVASAITQMPEAIDDTASAAGQVVEIVHAMRTMSHPGKSTHDPVDINQIVHDASVVSRNRWKQVAEIEYDLAPEPPTPRANAAAISQLVLNLIVNAADAVSETASEDDPGAITVRTRVDGDWVTIEVEDTGPGVPEELRQKVFDPFFTTKDVGKGTGQGLALCYDVAVRQHAGKIDVCEAPGGGARFVVGLPMAAEDPREEENDETLPSSTPDAPALVTA